MGTRSTGRWAGPSRHRRARRPWRWAPSVLDGCDEELGVIADRRWSDVDDVPSVP
jgi:hypothetical protein